jgi:ADP-ribosylglycohydrolase
MLGTAVGDSLGLPAENLSPAFLKRWRSGPGATGYSLVGA